MKRVAVTGATGHIGANLVRELLGRGYEVVALVRQTHDALKGLKVTRVQGDLLDRQSLCKAFRDVEDVYHLAAHISIEGGQREALNRINVEGTRNVVAACQSEQVSTLIYFSSIHALDQGLPGLEVNEDSPLVGGNRGEGGDYDLSKAMAESVVRDCADETLDTRIIYPTAVLGPNDFKLSLLGAAMIKMSQGRLPALVAGGYNWVDVRDVAWGAVEAVEKGGRGSRYILSGHYADLQELAGIIAELTGVTAPGFVCPLWLARLATPLLGLWARLSGQTPLYTPYSLSVLSENKTISHALASQELGYEPRSFRSSVRDALLSYRENGNL